MSRRGVEKREGKKKTSFIFIKRRRDTCIALILKEREEKAACKARDDTGSFGITKETHHTKGAVNKREGKHRVILRKREKQGAGEAIIPM